MLEKLRKLNWFADTSGKNEQNEKILHDQLLTTRIYLIFLTTGILVLAMVAFFEKVTIRVTVNNPSFDTYKKLDATFSNTLSCPCSNIAVSYSAFLSMETTYHQVKIIL